MKPSTAILVPVLNRPQNVRPLCESIEATTPEPHRVLFLVQSDDDAEWDAVSAEVLENAFIDILLVGLYRTTWAMKINEGFAATDEPYVFLGADDLRFHDGWLTEALRRAGTRETKDQVFPSVIGTNDQGNPRVTAGYHATHCLVRRSYIDEVGGVIDQPPGIVLNESYPHTYVDDEFVGTAQYRGVYAHADRSIVEHMHPLWGKAEMDDTYRLGMEGDARGRDLYQARCSMWGGDKPRRLRRSYPPQRRKRREQRSGRA